MRKSGGRKKKFAVFDIDGTIFRSSLLIEITEMCIHDGLFPSSAQKIYKRAYLDWLNRKDNYQKYIDRVVRAFAIHIRGVRNDAYQKVIDKVMAFHRNRVYRYTRDLIRDLKKKNYYLLAISGSPREMVDSFAHSLGFDRVYGSIYELDLKSRFTGKVLFLDFVHDKSKTLTRAVNKEHLTLKGSIGVGDSEADIAFLKLVEHPIAFNPNSVLYRYAKRAGWKIIVERKDVIYTL